MLAVFSVNGQGLPALDLIHSLMAGITCACTALVVAAYN